MTEAFPALVTDLPRIDAPLPGVTGWLLQGESLQAVFFRLEPGIVIPTHRHGAQWGMVVDGEIELTIGDETRLYRRGDPYDIPAGTPHAVRCPGGALALDLFADASRYKARA